MPRGSSFLTNCPTHLTREWPRCAPFQCAENEPFPYHGRWYQVDDARIMPPPWQRPGPPLVFAGGGERTAWRLVARYAHACNFGPGHATGLARTPGEERHKNAVLDRYCREEGRDPRSVLRTHFTSWLMLAPTETAAKEKCARSYPNGLTEEQRHSRVAAAPEAAIAYYQALVNAGMGYFVIQIEDASDSETIEILARAVMPHVLPASR